MARVTKLKRLPTEQRKYVEKLLREGQLTLDEMIAHIRAKYPEAGLSRSGLGRYSQKFAELAGRMRDIRAAGTAMVAELGEDPDDRGGQLLVEAVTSLATHAAMQANDPDAEVNLKEVNQLARAARTVLEARKLSLAERKEIARLEREQAADQADAAGRDAGLSEATIAQIRNRILQGGA